MATILYRTALCLAASIETLTSKGVSQAVNFCIFSFFALKCPTPLRSVFQALAGQEFISPACHRVSQRKMGIVAKATHSPLDMRLAY